MEEKVKQNDNTVKEELIYEITTIKNEMESFKNEIAVINIFLFDVLHGSRHTGTGMRK